MGIILQLCAKTLTALFAMMQRAQGPQRQYPPFVNGGYVAVIMGCEYSGELTQISTFFQENAIFLVAFEGFGGEGKILAQASLRINQ